ncbi:MAG: 3-isopropylmalate dehydratase [Tepidisphaerales bacterium]
MLSTITGKAYVLGDNIDTDQIIPAQYLSYNPAIPEERKYFGAYANSGVPDAQAGLPQGHVRFVEPGKFRSEFTIIVAGKNFGCGSSREHAPLALAEAGIAAVVAEFYARIFFRNCVNGAYLLPLETSERLCELVHTGDELSIDLSAGVLANRTRGSTHPLKPLGDVLPIIEAGGIFEYARQTGMIR